MRTYHLALAALVAACSSVQAPRRSSGETAVRASARALAASSPSAPNPSPTPEAKHGVDDPTCVSGAPETFSIDPIAEQHMLRADEAFASRDQSLEQHLRAAAAAGHPRGHYNLGVVLQRTGRYGPAALHLQRALSVNPCYHAARLELARMAVEGWGVTRDPELAVRMFEEVAAEGPPALQGIAWTNLGLHALYGLGVRRSVRDARRWWERADAVGQEDAGALLAAMPEGPDPWGDVPLDPPRGQAEVHVFRSAPAGPSEVPDWVPSNSSLTRDSAVPMGAFVVERTIANGVPGEDAGSLPVGTETLEEFISIGPRWVGAELTVLTWQSNRSTCFWEGDVVGDPSSGTLVARSRRRETYVDEVSRRERSLPGCFLRMELRDGRAHVAEDWPESCSLRSCGHRGGIVGRIMPAAQPGVSGHDVARRMAQRLVDGLSRPEWTRETEELDSRALIRRYGGVWTHVHPMPVLGGRPDAEAWVDQDVRDELTICGSASGTPTFALQNWTINDHSCDVEEGRPSLNREGELLLVIDGPSSIWVPEVRSFARGLPCTARTRLERGALEIVDVWPPECDIVHCGARARLTAASFPRRSRRRSCRTATLGR